MPGEVYVQYGRVDEANFSAMVYGPWRMVYEVEKNRPEFTENEDVARINVAGDI
jgi:hypothetical protein